MKKSYIKTKFNEFTSKFSSFFRYEKKVRALDRFCSVTECEASTYIPLIRNILKDGFLDEVEEQFIDYQIEKATIDPYTWAYRTKWVKSEMVRLSEEKKKKEEQLALPIEIPVQFLRNDYAMRTARI